MTLRKRRGDAHDVLLLYTMYKRYPAAVQQQHGFEL